MNKIRMKGKEVNEAVESAAKVLGISEDKVQFRVISEGKPGMLGVFGGEEAEVEAWVAAMPSEAAKDALQEILNKLGLLAIAEIVAAVDDDVELNIKGEELGQVIGKDGLTLISLQTILSAMMSHSYQKKIRVFVDAGGYRDRQKKALERLAKDAADDVERTGQEKTLPPMSAADRRIIHISLKERDKITTYSVGEGADRRLIISPK